MNRPVVTTLRDIVPIRPLSRLEAMRLAELQAQRFLRLAGATAPPVPAHIITELPKLQITRMRPFPASGATRWKHGSWTIILNAGEPRTRQRFSLAHEFKHILDHRFIDLIYNGVPAGERDAWTERVCDFFAGCLLVPRPWLKQAYGAGVQAPERLARHFDVSEAAIQTRLDQIGLSMPRERCERSPKWTLPDERGAGTPSWLYQRQRRIALVEEVETSTFPPFAVLTSGSP